MAIATQIVADNLTKELGSFFSTEAHTWNNIIRYINSWVRAICIAKNFWFNKYEHDIEIIDWTTKYNIPFQIETFFILDSSWEEVETLEFEDYYRRTDKSDIIWIWEDKLVSEMIWDFTIFYRGYPTTITELSSSIDIPEHFFDLLVVIASYFWYADVRSFQTAAEKKNIFNWMIKDMATRNSDTKPLKTKRLNKSRNKTW